MEGLDAELIKTNPDGSGDREDEDDGGEQSLIHLAEVFCSVMKSHPLLTEELFSTDPLKLVIAPNEREIFVVRNDSDSFFLG